MSVWASWPVPERTDPRGVDCTAQRLLCEMVGDGGPEQLRPAVLLVLCTREEKTTLTGPEHV